MKIIFLSTSMHGCTLLIVEKKMNKIQLAHIEILVKPKLSLYGNSTRQTLSRYEEQIHKRKLFENASAISEFFLIKDDLQSIKQVNQQMQQNLNIHNKNNKKQKKKKNIKQKTTKIKILYHTKRRS